MGKKTRKASGRQGPPSEAANAGLPAGEAKSKTDGTRKRAARAKPATPTSMPRSEQLERQLAETRIGLDLIARLQPKQTSRSSAKTGDGITSSAASTSKHPPAFFDVIIEFNRDYPDGIAKARRLLIDAWLAGGQQNMDKPTAGIEKREAPADYDLSRAQVLSLAVAATSAKNAAQASENVMTKVETESTKTEIAKNKNENGQFQLPNNEIKLVNILAVQGTGIWIIKSLYTENYLFAHLTEDQIQQLATWRQDATNPGSSPAPEATSAQAKPAEGKAGGAFLVYKIWLDHETRQLTTKSIVTVKADAAHRSFSAWGDNIVWAVIDTGVDETHAHFRKHKNLELPPSLRHMSFTKLARDPAAAPDKLSEDARIDTAGHGTHVAGIIAGAWDGESEEAPKAVAHIRTIEGQAPDERPSGNDQSDLLNSFGTNKDVVETSEILSSISGIAPKCKIMSLKVTEKSKDGRVSDLLAAIGYIFKMNDYGRNLRIHGANISLGYSFDPEWHATGQSPLCVEVDRLARSGVVVVVAAGNTGHGMINPAIGGGRQGPLLATIMDPGNAALAITVGATHRDMPHVYGVSYFSSKGPTGDGRAKPDLVAPGERIRSCKSNSAAPAAATGVPEGAIEYTALSGTSMAAPHVSGAIAAFLSVRREFLGQPLRVKEIFMKSATDLGRKSDYQGAGLVDLMRALQSV